MRQVKEQIRLVIVTRHQATLPVFGLVLAYALFNAILFAADWSNGDMPESLLVFAGCCAIQPMLLGLWAALGPGAFLLRLPLVANALVLVVLATILLPPLGDRSLNSENELVVWLVLVGAMIFVFATILGAVVRWWSRQSIQLFGDSTRSHSPIRFSVKYILGLTTVTAVSLAMAGRAISRLREPLDRIWSDVDVFALAVTPTIIFAICLPIAVVPWIILSGLPRAPLVVLGLLFWFLWTIVTAVVLKNAFRPPENIFPFLLSIQFGAVAVSLGSGLVLRAFGFQLVTNSPTVALPASNSPIE